MLLIAKLATLLTCLALECIINIVFVSAISSPSHVPVNNKNAVTASNELTIPACACTGTSSSSPTHVATQHDGNDAKADINSLNADERSLIWSRISIQDMANCRRVCKEWKQVVSSEKSNLSGYSSMQDFLQRALEGSLHGTKSEQMNTLQLLKAAPIRENMCSVVETFAIKVAAKYGHIHVLDQIYSRKVNDRMREKMLKLACQGENPHSFNEYLFEKADTVSWCMGKITSLPSSDGVHRTKQNVLAQGLYHRISSVYNDTTLASWGRMDVHLLLLVGAAAKSNPESLLRLTEQIAKGISTVGIMELAVLSGLANCRKCEGADMASVLDIFHRRHPNKNRDQLVKDLLLGSCRTGNIRMVQIIQQRHPQLAIANRANVEFAVDSGNTELVELLLRSNPKLKLDWTYFNGLTRLVELNKYVSGAPDWRTAPFTQLVQVYLDRGCGNEQDLSSFKTIIEHSTEPLTDAHLQMPIRRTFLGSYFSCRRNESTQFIEYLLKVKKIIPTQASLRLAMETGRLDVVKLIVEEGRKLGVRFVFTIDTLEWIEHWDSYQEPALLDYILKQMDVARHGSLLTADEKWLLKQLLRPSRVVRKKLDCYRSQIKRMLAEK